MLTFNKLGSEDLLTTKEASALSGYSTDYIGQLCREGRVEAKRVKKSWNISKKSLDKYLKVNKKKVIEENSKQTIPEPPRPDFGQDVKVTPRFVRDVSLSNRSKKKEKKISLVRMPLVHTQFSGKKLARLHSAIQNGSMKATQVLGSSTENLPAKDFWHKAISLITAIVLVFGSYAMWESGAHTAFLESTKLMIEQNHRKLTASISRSSMRMNSINVKDEISKVSKLEQKIIEKTVFGAQVVRLAKEELVSNPFLFALNTAYNWGGEVQSFFGAIESSGKTIASLLKDKVVAAIVKK